MTSERYSRQAGLVPPEMLESQGATVVGVGAIGRQVALQLTAIGMPRLQLVDFDTVEESNITSQGFYERHLGLLKVDAVYHTCKEINPAVKIDDVPNRFRRSQYIEANVFCCVDSMAARTLVWESVKDRCRFFVDGRMAGESCRILTAFDAQGREHYSSTLFPDSEAFQGSCTTKTTIYCANIAAGLMVAQFAKSLRGVPMERDVTLNILTSELMVG